MKEYWLEDDVKVDLNKLQSQRLSMNDYEIAHKSLVQVCHDVVIEYNGGILLVERKNYPAKDVLWPIGGRVERGTPVVYSLRKKVKEECNLELEDIVMVGCARTFFSTDPFGHLKGTDTFNILFYAKGLGELKLDANHENPVNIYPKDYTQEFKNKIHPYVKDFMDKTIHLWGKI